MKQHEYYDYWYWENVISQSNIEILNDFIKNNYDGIEDPNKSARDNEGNRKKNSLCRVIKWFKIRQTMDYVLDLAYHVNNEYFGYNIYPMTAEKELLHSSYSADNEGKYDWHTDGTQTPILDVKLTCIINLSESNFEGGDFQFMNGNVYDIKGFNKPGSMIIFRSFLNHRVMPVTKGNRTSLTTFLTGPRFI